MASKIEWTEATWNPVVGCSIVSPGCTHCYAMKMAGRLQALGVEHYAGTTQKTKAGHVWTGKVTTAPDHIVTAPLRWKKPRVIFVNSMSDLFHDDVPFDVVDRIFAVMALTPQHTYQVLTKRPDRMRKYMIGRAQKLAAFMVDTFITSAPDAKPKGRATSRAWPFFKAPKTDLLGADGVTMTQWPLPNVWLGVSAEDQARWDERVPELMWTPAAKRFVSIEPMLGPIDPTKIDVLGGHAEIYPLDWTTEVEDDDGQPMADIPPLDWIIVGGESGPAARPMHPDWARKIRDACGSAGPAFFFKQWGSWKEAFHDEDGPRVDLVETDSDTADSIMVMFAGRQTTFLNAQGDTFRGHYENLPPDQPWRLMVQALKRANGRRLDGVEHNGMPAVSHG